MKPVEVNILGNTARGCPPTQPNSMEPMPFPYGYYPPPLLTPNMYYSGLGFPQAFPGYGGPPPSGLLAPTDNVLQQKAPTPSASTLPPQQALKYPRILEWIEYCDQHPNRSDGNLGTLIPKLQAQGFCYINQLTGDHITIEKLSDWLSIGAGTADLLIRFAQEDCQLIAQGSFAM
jgi:hypothetical protein